MNWSFEEEPGATTPQVLITLVSKYIDILNLSQEPLQLTTSRTVFGRWLGRRIPSGYGGAYVYLSHQHTHAVLINLQRIELQQPKALEIVVCEELMHMRDWIDGDRRRHARHGHDRIAYRVAELTGASLEEVRAALIPVRQRPYRYVYGCPRCGMRVKRKQQGQWACGRCYRSTGKQFVLTIVERLGETSEASEQLQ